jgi:hypothetical protein
MFLAHSMAALSGQRSGAWRFGVAVVLRYTKVLSDLGADEALPSEWVSFSLRAIDVLGNAIVSGVMLLAEGTFT